MKLNHLLLRMIFLAVPVFLVILTSTVCLFAQEVSLAPGTYVTEGGWGDLTIKRAKDGKLSFKIFAMGGNAHMCDLEGEIKNGRATLVDSGDVCVIRFSPMATSVEVIAETAEPCRYYCGMRARFEGVYLKPTAACIPKAINKSRANFKRLYNTKAYVEAVGVLVPILKGCVKTMDWLDKGWIRNDLALTYHKQGRDDLCLQSLKELAEDAAKTDGQIREEYPPSDADNYLPIVKATRTNLKLCGSGKKTKP